MTTGELAKALSAAHKNAPSGDKALAIHLFGIRHAEELEHCSVEAVIKASSVPPAYGTEVRKGMKIARHVTLNRL